MLWRAGVILVQFNLNIFEKRLVVWNKEKCCKPPDIEEMLNFDGVLLLLNKKNPHSMISKKVINIQHNFQCCCCNVKRSKTEVVDSIFWELCYVVVVCKALVFRIFLHVYTDISNIGKHKQQKFKKLHLELKWRNCFPYVVQC